MGARRSQLTAAERSRAAVAVAARLAALPEMQEAVRRGDCVAGFAATRNEIDPLGALERARREGARLAWPRVPAAASAVPSGEAEQFSDVAHPGPRLRFHLAAPGDLRPGRFGIDEPDAACPEIAASDVAVMLVPGLAFDARGNRLGFGGGYYDELLAESVTPARRPALVVAVGYDFQVVDACPVDQRDARVDCVVTDGRVIRCQQSSDPATDREVDR